MSVFWTLLGLRLRGPQRRSMFALVCVSALATVGLVAGIEVRSGIGTRVDRLYVETGKPDLIIIGGPNAIPPAIERAKNEGLISAAFVYQAAFGSLERPDGTGVGIGFVAADDFASVDVGAPILRTGRWPRDGHEIVLDVGAAVVHDYGVGTQVRIERNGDVIELTVVGTAVDLTDCFYPACMPLRGFVTHGGLARISPEGPYARANARLSDGIDESEAAERIRSYERVSSVDTWSGNRSDILLAGQIFSVFLAGFGGFVLLATLLVVASTAVGAIIARRRELGLLKALGASSGQLLAVTLFEQVVVGLVGVVIGWVAGCNVAPFMQIGLVEVLGRSQPRYDLSTLVLAGLAMGTVLIIATVVPARAAGRLSVRSALADSPPDRSGAGLGLIQRLPFGPPSLLGIQLALSRPVRACLSAMAIAVAVAAALAGWRLSSGVNMIVNEPGLAGDPYDVLVAAPPTLAVGFVDAALAGVAGVGSWYTEDATTAQLGGADVGLRGIGSRVEDAGLILADGRMPNRPNEALAGWGILKDSELAIGDSVEVQVEERTLALTIVGRHGDLDHDGRAIVVSMSDYRRVVGTSREHWRVSSDGSVEAPELARRIEKALDGQALVQPATQVGGQLRPFQFVLALLVVLVGLVAAANLAATLVASNRERRREMGVVRALGFSDRELLMQSVSSGAVLGLIGICLGIPVGFVASRMVIASAVDQIGLGPGLLDPAMLLPTVVVGACGVSLSVGVSVIATRRMRSVSATELIREI